MTNIYGFHRPATASISNTDPPSLPQVWQSLRRKLKKSHESNQNPTTKYDTSSITKDDTLSVISDADTLVVDAALTQQKGEKKL
jgi:hypothetical protein